MHIHQTKHPARRRSLAPALMLVVALCLVAGGPAPPASAQATSGPELSIAIDDGHTSAKVAQELTYTITVRNLGAEALAGMLVTQTKPAGLVFKAADAGGTDAAGTVTWVVDLAANATVTVHSTLKVSTTPKELLRLASVACAQATAAGPPIVCATDSDQLPAGAAAAAKATAAATSSSDGGSHAGVWIALGAVVVAAGGVFVALRRRVRARPSA